jgi:hypothetical protein
MPDLDVTAARRRGMRWPYRTAARRAPCLTYRSLRVMPSVDLARRQLATRGGMTDLEVAVGEVATMLRIDAQLHRRGDKHAKRFQVPDRPT